MEPLDLTDVHRGNIELELEVEVEKDVLQNVNRGLMNAGIEFGCVLLLEFVTSHISVIHASSEILTELKLLC